MGRGEALRSAPRIRLKQLAFELGISQTTVSRALAGYGDVSKETRKRVVEAARSSGYLHARAASRPRGPQSGYVGMLLPIPGGDIIDPHLTEFVAGLSARLMRHGRDLFLATVPLGQDDLTVLKRLVMSQRIDAMVVHRPTHDDPCVRFLLDNDCPFVTLGRLLVPHSSHPWFDMDTEAAFEWATTLLIELGHRTFGVFGPSEPFSYAAIRRLGIDNALRRYDIALLPENVVKAPVSESGTIAVAAKALLLSPRRPTAIIGIQDKYGIAILEAASRLGISVPGELSVIGFGDLPGAAQADPPLSTFAQHARTCGETAADMIINQLETGLAAVIPRLIEVDFVARGSHGPWPIPCAGHALSPTSRCD